MERDSLLEASLKTDKSKKVTEFISVMKGICDVEKCNNNIENCNVDSLHCDVIVEDIVNCTSNESYYSRSPSGRKRKKNKMETSTPINSYRRGK